MSTEQNHQEPDPQDPGSEDAAESRPEIEQSEAQSATGEVEQLTTDLANAKDQVLRTHAEMQNLRRRMERDVENAHKYALEKFVGELLPVVDNLERSIQAMADVDGDFKAVSDGIELTLKSFQDVLARFKVEAVDPGGEAFNPDLHQAMSMLEVPDAKPNTVIDVFQKGYTLNGRLIRPAMVVVAKSAANNTSEP
ncbi:nucleotide exchange factor GrpE [Porticoccus hydrocarbonoclasticus]|uniref:nucleotide exchange factor GrpE n=1 Tax=Porticoccus hydrocarbonoclasticus TaxID=1073414 RepID=UPI0023559D95|nr:nucleotide exchange factor GrpE [Porticoccus hydrocarbonoclasticus]